LSGFIARHIEQPGLRHSKPALINTVSSPSVSAWILTWPEPGTTNARSPGGNRAAFEDGRGKTQVFYPRVGAGPDKYRVHLNFSHGCARLKAHVSQGALARFAGRRLGKALRVRYCLVQPTTWPGLVPQVT